jgi:hypothetical protein
MKVMAASRPMSALRTQELRPGRSSSSARSAVVFHCLQGMAIAFAHVLPSVCCKTA